LFAKEAKDEVTAVAAYLATLRDPAADKERESLAADIDLRLEREKTSGQKLNDGLMSRYLCGGCHTDMSQAADDGRIGLSEANLKFPKGAMAAYLQNPQKHYAWNMMPNFRLSREEAVELEIMIGRKGWKGEEKKYTDTPDQIALGKKLVGDKGCLACHEMGNNSNKLAKLDLMVDRKPSGKSCVDGSSGVVFGFEIAQSEALAAFLKTNAKAALNNAPAEAFERQSEKLRCNGCHGTYEGFPALDNLGAKLKPEWMTRFIGGQVQYKPRGEKHPDGHEWLPARMPGFGGRAALLAEGLAAQSGFGPTSAPEKAVDPELKRVGAQLVSADGGFSCVGCHSIGKQVATQVFEAEGVNLAYSAERLRPEFFRRWVRNPLKVDPQTKMPTYFDESGASPLQVLGGDGEKQIDAMWNFVRSLPATK